MKKITTVRFVESLGNNRSVEVSIEDKNAWYARITHETDLTVELLYIKNRKELEVLSNLITEALKETK